MLGFPWKHLHGRGEDGAGPVTFCAICRNTSTDVEKTAQTRKSKDYQQKHLHGRGEDSPSS